MSKYPHKNIISAMSFEQGHIRMAVYKENDSLHQPSSPQAAVLRPSWVHSHVVWEICLLCWAAVSPGDTYPAAQGAGESVHSITHRSP